MVSLRTETTLSGSQSRSLAKVLTEITRDTLHYAHR